MTLIGELKKKNLIHLKQCGVTAQLYVSALFKLNSTSQTLLIKRVWAPGNHTCAANLMGSSQRPTQKSDLLPAVKCDSSHICFSI